MIGQRVEYRKPPRAHAFNHVAVLMGGLSAEREVSLRFRRGLCRTRCESAGYKVTRIDAGRDLAQRLAEVKPDVCFNALHGRWGEDGCVQGLLELLRHPLHAFGRAGLRARHAQGARQGRDARGRHARRRRPSSCRARRRPSGTCCRGPMC